TPAAAVIILNTDPGGYCPLNSTSPARSAASVWTTARISPDDGLMATIIVCESARKFTASSAARCTSQSMLTRTAGEGSGACSRTWVKDAPSSLTTSTDQP